MKIFVTGGAGYIGSHLVRRLLKSGHDVTVFDTLYFGTESINELNDNSKFHLIQGDIRNREALEQYLPGHDAVIHLAAIVGDPACAADADLAVSVNFNATILVAELAKKFGINRFVFASTCSVYGANQDVVSETSELNPLSLYAQTRLYGERGIRALSDASFRPVTLRFGTVYGLSPRMRFDLVVNYLSQKLFREGEISIFGGEQWRPLVHVADAAMALELALNADPGKVGGEVFNVGKNEHNYQLKSLVPIFQNLVPSAKITIISELDDKRSYRVEFEKIDKVLGFRPEHTVEDGIAEILEVLKLGKIANTDDIKYHNHKVIAHVTGR